MAEYVRKHSYRHMFVSICIKEAEARNLYVHSKRSKIIYNRKIKVILNKDKLSFCLD